MDNFIWTIIFETCALINSEYLYLRAERYYILKLFENENQKAINFHPDQIQMTCVYRSRIIHLVDCRKGRI